MQLQLIPAVIALGRSVAVHPELYERATHENKKPPPLH